MSKNSSRVPLVVIGGGAAGLVAAITAARNGVHVVVLEKNAVVGKKLSITGGGRCNITNATPRVRDLLSQYGEAGKFLFSPFSQFGVAETRSWFAQIGVETVEQAERRVFPVHESAPLVTKALIDTARSVGVIIRTRAPVLSLTKTATGFVVTLAKETIHADAVILATGGVSHPETGSTGDALPWLTTMGHTVVAPESSLVPVAVTELDRARLLSGIALLAAGIRVYDASQIVYQAMGKVLFTHFGLSGPGVLNASHAVVLALKNGQASIELDLLPAQSEEILEAWLISKTMQNRNKLVVNYVRELLPTVLVKVVMESAGLNPSLPAHALTVSLRRQLIAALKHFRWHPSHVLGPEHAIVTAGGVALTEINFKTMESRLTPQLYVVGDVLNINRPSGGYSLQLCWTTGYVAGVAASEALS